MICSASTRSAGAAHDPQRSRARRRAPPPCTPRRAAHRGSRGRDAGKVELHRQRLGEQARVAARHPGAAALAHADLGDAEGLQCAQRVARDDPAHAEPRRQILLGAEELTGLQPLGEQRIAHLGDDLRRQRSAASGEKGRPVCWTFGASTPMRVPPAATVAEEGKIVKILSYEPARLAPSTPARTPARSCRSGRAGVDDRSPRCRCRRRSCRPRPGQRR